GYGIQPSMYGDARRPEDKQHHNDELYARLHAIERKDSRRISYSAEPKIKWWLRHPLTLAFCLLSILTSRSRSAYTLLYPCFYTLLRIWSLYTSCGGCLSTGYCVSLLYSFYMTRIPPPS